MPPMLTDAEHAFADSLEGRAAIDREARQHRLREAHRGAQARPWTDALAADATRRLMTAHARRTISTAATLANSERQTPAEYAAYATERALRRDAVANGWKRG